MDVAVSTSFVLSLVFVVAAMIMQMQRSSASESSVPTVPLPTASFHAAAAAHALPYWYVLLWCVLIVYYLLRFMTLSGVITEHHASTATILAEQLNVMFRMASSVERKAELVLCNNLLKCATKLLKELEQPKKVSGISMSPVLSQVTRVVVLSAFSAIVSDLLGFKLKLFKLGKAI
ncbi:hypothetical protein EON66_10360 [archaeon]|nr:MAG: hypothetical protein EON66_10360 [archaeon]